MSVLKNVTSCVDVSKSFHFRGFQVAHTMNRLQNSLCFINTRKEKHMTAILNTLKLTAARKTRALPDVVKRRNKLLIKLGEQRMLAAALEQGEHYAPTRYRTFKDTDTGARVVKQVPVRIKPWFWTGEKGECLLAVTYGSKQIELVKGKTAIEVGEQSNLCTVLDTVIAAVKNGELDTQIESASAKLRDGFKK
jgi:hypothetical protein